jgi:processing peptidase subunit alpha
LGLPKICPEANLLTIDRSVLFTYLKHHYTPKRMVVAGVGVDHNALVESVQKYFVDMKPIWEEDTDLVLPAHNMKVDDSVAQYTGGMVQV